MKSEPTVVMINGGETPIVLEVIDDWIRLHIDGNVYGLSGTEAYDLGHAILDVRANTRLKQAWKETQTGE